jgi:tRNA splicing endonuclease
MADEILTGRLQGEKVKLGQEALADLYEQGYFGRPSGKGLDLSLVEAAYLLDRSRIRVLSDSREISFKDFFQAASSWRRASSSGMLYTKISGRGATTSSQEGLTFESTRAAAILEDAC